jgi:hypothetical protein
MSSISLDAFDAKSKSALSLSSFEQSFDVNPSKFFFPRQKCKICMNPDAKCKCCKVEGFEPDAEKMLLAGIKEFENEVDSFFLLCQNSLAGPESETLFKTEEDEDGNEPEDKIIEQSDLVNQMYENVLSQFENKDEIKSLLVRYSIESTRAFDLKNGFTGPDTFNLDGYFNFLCWSDFELDRKIEAEEKEELNKKLKAYANPSGFRIKERIELDEKIELNKKLKAWAKSTIKMLKSMS